jgi:acetyl esterase/lipase
MTIHGTPVALAGDSAGGGLALAVAQAAGADGLPAPRALALISPWVDLTLSGESCRTKSDAMLTLPALERAAAAYARELGPRHRTCSPLRGDLRGLPPTLVHVGGEELLLSDAESLARAAREAGVDVELRVFTGLFHDFHTFAGILAEADEALAEMGAWIAARVAAA